MTNLDLLDKAELDLLEAALWYERESEGLGFRFEEAVRGIFKRISENPLQFPHIEAGVRRALVRRFPYAVFFLPGREMVIVFAVLHQHADPAEWKTRRLRL